MGISFDREERKKHENTGYLGIPDSTTWEERKIENWSAGGKRNISFTSACRQYFQGLKSHYCVSHMILKCKTKVKLKDTQ